TYEIKNTGRYEIIDHTWDKTIKTDDTVYAIMTMEGFGIVSQTKKNVVQTGAGTTLISGENHLKGRIDFLKLHLPVIFITFSHHFTNGLCGHTRSFPVLASSLRFLHQKENMDQPFSSLGMRVILRLLSLEQTNTGWVYNKAKLGRRILIDLKHMALKSRLAIYQLVRAYNESTPANGDKIPLVASHVAYSGLTMADMLFKLQGAPNLEQQGNQLIRRDRTYKYKDERKVTREVVNNTWSINLAAEEIQYIVDSKGLIGLSFEQNILGVDFFGEGKKKREDKSHNLYLILNQLLDMGRICKDATFWKHITIGTDFDGMINPVDRYPSALFFQTLKQDLKWELLDLADEELKDAKLSPPPAGVSLEEHIDQVLDGLFIQNAFDLFWRNKQHLQPTSSIPNTGSI
ncbi:MAG: hypothetical protein AAF242_05050, partial [Bacteroidota bacterium]